MAELNICNIPVSFPYKPYTSQISMMTRIINGLNKKQNCLLELPTGSGKTMALLSATLAWYNDNASKNELKFKQKSVNETPLCDQLDENANIDVTNTGNTIKIYFGTRTHKQIGQAIRELRKSKYSQIKMSILSGRKQSCVNNDNLQSANVDEGCKTICKSVEGCFYKKSQDNPLPNKVWDIESIKPELKQKRICPHYQLKTWKNEANIIFCPYSYIIDPFIRKSMGINLENAIVIFDEAHNVEEICRQGSSMSISQSSLNECQVQLYKLFQRRDIDNRYRKLIDLIKSIDSVITKLSIKPFIKDEDVLKKSWEGNEIITAMKNNNITFQSINEYRITLSNLFKHLDEIRKQIKMEEESTGISSDEVGPSISSATFQILETFIMISTTLLDENKNHAQDFGIVITEGESYLSQDIDINKEITGQDLWKNAKTQKKSYKNNFILNMWCMNPGIVFKTLSEKTHSIILTSGTLSPITSFELELDCKFESVLEAYHIVNANRTFVASIGQGPKGTEMQAVYKNTCKLSFQDDLGRMLLGCCQVVPNGVLCFLSSFTMLEIMFARWKETKLLSEIEKYKTIVVEPRNNADMDVCMKLYYDKIATGALLFAVFRGKASEGMDFSDEAARLVITVGIPYPSVADPQILLKKNYNNIKSKEMKAKGSQYLTGSDWYNIQAFRALNQAIGRCIRHRDDWGAMIMVDSRFGDGQNMYSKGLCKWISSRQKSFHTWHDLHFDLQAFMNHHKNSDMENVQKNS